MTCLIVGADIASRTIQLHWHHQATGEIGERQIKQTPSSYQTIIDRWQHLAQPEDTHVIMEATGTYWLYFALALHEANIRVSVMNPRQAYYFAQYNNSQTKNDRVDARLLCRIGRMDPPDLWTPPPPVYHALYQRLTLRHELQDSRTQYRNRLHALRRNPYARPAIVDRYERLLADLKAEIDQLTAEIDDLLKADHAWREAARRLQTIMERVVEEVSYTASDRDGESLVVDADYVKDRVDQLAKNTDLSKFIL